LKKKKQYKYHYYSVWSYTEWLELISQSDKHLSLSKS